MSVRIWACLLLLACVGAGFAEDEAPTISGFKVPEYDDEGNKKSELKGDLAKMDPRGGDIEISNLRMEYYKDNETEMLITAPRCTYNQKKGIAYSRSDVRMERENMVVTGTGFAYSRSNEVFRIFSDTKVVMKNVRAETDVLGGKE